MGNCCQPFFAAYLHAQLVSTGPPFSHGTFSRELFGWKWMGNVGKIPRKRPGWVPLCGLSPGGEIILGVLEMPGTPQKRKRTANHPISPEIGKNCQKKQMKPHTFPTHSHYGQREFFGRKWREYGRNRGADAKLGKPLEESQVGFFFRAFPRGEIILEVLEMPGTPEKQKGAAATITKQIQKLAKKN